jgi:hypothetical protein
MVHYQPIRQHGGQLPRFVGCRAKLMARMIDIGVIESDEMGSLLRGQAQPCNHQFDSCVICLSDQLKAANDYHFKTGQEKVPGT